MSPEELKAKAQRFIEEVWNNHDLSAIEEFIAPEYTITGSQPPVEGPDGYRQFAQAVLAAFPDIHFTVEEFITTGDKTVMRWAWQGTHRGTWMGVPATGKVISGTGVSISRMTAAGKALEERMIGDNLAVLVQMGAITLPTPTPA
jgi:steroid delta-isomerase-like uncharacterized protein